MTQAAWLLRDGQVLAAAEVADRLADRARGLMRCPEFDGVLVLPGVVTTHSALVRTPIDVAFLDRGLVVVATVQLAPWRVARPRPRARMVLATPAGAFERWRLGTGDQLEIRDAR